MNGKIGRKAVLVYPGFQADTFWSFWRSFERYVPRGKNGMPKQLLPPLGLMGLYSHLKPFYDEIMLVDRNVDPRPLERLVSGADHVFIGGMIAQEAGFLKDARIVKKAGKKLIAGGTIVDEESPLMQIADHLIDGEAENVIDDLLAGLASGKAEKFYRGTPALPEKFFRPDFSSIDINNYVNMSMQISRGCPENCEFCDITARFGKKPRIAPWAHTEAALKQLSGLGSRQPIFFVDDNFIGHPRQAVETLKRIHALEERQGFHPQKITELTMRLADDTPVMNELRKWLYRTSFTVQFIGVETNNTASLREAGKSHNIRGNDSMEDKLKKITEKTGAAIMTGMIYGFDNDTAEVKPLIDFINSTHAPMAMVGLLNAMPRTQLWNRLRKEGRLKVQSAGNNSDGTINFIPYNFSARQAEENYVKILEGIYDEDAYFGRVMKELELISPVSPQITRTLREGAYSAMKVFTGEHALSFWKHLPGAHAIARKRFGFNTPGYGYLLSEYITYCGKYTHLKGQTEHLREQINRRKYAPWQLYSWRELQESPVRSVEAAEQSQPAPSLFDRVRMQLNNGYEFMGTRWEALSHFIEPHLKAELRKLKEISIPSLLNAEIRAYWTAHVTRPEILKKLNFAEVEKYLRTTVQDQMDYLDQMSNILRNARQSMAFAQLPVSEE